MSYPSNFRPGQAVIFDGVPFVCVDFEHQKYGRGSATIRLKFKNLKTGATIDRSFKGKEDLEEADVSFEQAQYLYKEGTNYAFMHGASFDQVSLPADQVGKAAPFLKEGETYELMLINGEAFGVKLPPKVVLKVTDAEPGVRGDTAQSPAKRATLET